MAETNRWILCNPATEFKHGAPGGTWGPTQASRNFSLGTLASELSLGICRLGSVRFGSFRFGSSAVFFGLGSFRSRSSLGVLRLGSLEKYFA